MAIRDLGTPDSNLRTSPILQPVEMEERPTSDDNTTLPVCYFNGEEFESGSFVRSGEAVLRCESGIWAALPRDEDDYLE